jgi:hypothetical protein
MGIGKKMEENVQLQEFVEHVLCCAYDYLTIDMDFTLDDICDELGITRKQAMWMFEQLGYEREGHMDIFDIGDDE